MQAHAPDLLTQRVSVAFWPVDVVTLRGGAAALEITVEGGGRGRKRNAIRTASGYYSFEELERRVHTFRVRDARVNRPHYLEQQLIVDIGVLDPEQPVVQIDLLPAPDYPFEGGITLVRGTVVDSSDTPIAGARIELRDADVLGPPNPRGASRSDASGAFAVVVSPDVPGDAASQPEPATTLIALRATDRDGRTGRATVEVRRGYTASARIVVPTP